MATVPTPVPTPKRKPASKPERHTVQVQFTTDSDIALYNQLKEEAEADRRPLPLYILLILHQQQLKPVTTTQAETT